MCWYNQIKFIIINTNTVVSTKVRWQGYLWQESWEKEANFAGARAAVEEFWIALEEPMPDSEVFRRTDRNEVSKRLWLVVAADQEEDCG